MYKNDYVTSLRMPNISSWYFGIFKVLYLASRIKLPSFYGVTIIGVLECSVKCTKLKKKKKKVNN